MNFLSLKTALILLILHVSNSALHAQINAIYAGGAIHDPAQPLSNVDELRNSNYNTVIIWTIHILDDGSLNLNYVNDIIDANSNYIGGDALRNRIARLKQAPTNITRLEFGVGSASGQQFDVIKNYFDRDGGFPPSSPIYKSFKTLRETFPFVDAINNDDEVTYDVPSAVAFTKMLAGLGFKNAIVPYRNASSYWGPLVKQVNAEYPGNVDINYIQCYAGGADNDPCQSQWDFGITNVGGLWGGRDQMSTTSIKSKMKQWKTDCGFKGGFIWVYDSLIDSSGSYSDAIKSVITNSSEH